MLKNSIAADLVNGSSLVARMLRSAHKKPICNNLQISKSLMPAFIKRSQWRPTCNKMRTRAPEGRDERENTMAKKTLKKSKKLGSVKPLTGKQGH